MLERVVVVGPFQCNCRIFACPRTGHALVVDPGDDSAQILKELREARLPNGQPVEVKFLFHTHAHLDHIGATRAVKESLGSGAIIALHRDDEPLYRQLKVQGRLFGIEYEDPLPVERFVEEGEKLAVGDLRFTLLHTPGHSPGSVSLRLHEDSALGVLETVMTGDTLFQGSVGRTDLWGGNQDLLFKSIRDRLLVLDGDTRVCPGHGPDTSIGIEKRKNPYLL